MQSRNITEANKQREVGFGAFPLSVRERWKLYEESLNLPGGQFLTLHTGYLEGDLFYSEAEVFEVRSAGFPDAIMEFYVLNVKLSEAEVRAMEIAYQNAAIAKRAKAGQP